MNVLAAIAGIVLIFTILQDCFETVVLPRRVARKFRLARLFYATSWLLWSAIARKLRSNNRREYFISFYGPLSLLLLLIIWALMLIIAFALLQWSLGSVISAPEKTIGFLTDLYMSGTTFFTLGLGDVVPRSGWARACTVVESGLGFGFLALVIGYAPIIYQAFSRREAEITLLDARAGSPPTAAEFIRRHLGENLHAEEFVTFLRSWERWCAELLESHLSYPVLSYYRSQHDRQSWLAALTTILDVCALVMVGLDNIPEQTGKFTFAIARHAVVDLSQSFGTEPSPPKKDRLPSTEFARLQEQMAAEGIQFRDEETAEERLTELRHMYEPYANALANYLLTPLPEWISTVEHLDDWQSSIWDHFALTSQRPMRKR
ncbi:MAG TPA: potassium channel family protein [Ktedonosporobacter sp.]|jgi:hypothetical protein|nr:potassium channel family protein [Ktedonosporobacter sp.]